MIKSVLTYLFSKNMSLADAIILITACACFFHHKWIAGLATMLVGGFIVSMMEVFLAT